MQPEEPSASLPPLLCCIKELTLKTELTAARLRELLHYDPETGVFTRLKNLSNSKAFKVGDVAGGLDKSTGYIKISVENRRYWAHRLAWLYVHGVWPSSGIDHRDENGLNNAISNLRPASKSENGQNVSAARSSSKSGLLGASPTADGRWTAAITVSGKMKNLGRFDSPEEAHAAYIDAKTKLHPFRNWEALQPS